MKTITILAIAFFAIASVSIAADAQKSKGVYLKLFSGKVKDAKTRATYTYTVAIDTTGHDIAGCPKLNGVAHLQIDVDKDGKPYSRMHIGFKKGSRCVIIAHDARLNIYCQEYNWCSRTRDIVEKILSGAYPAALAGALYYGISSNWPTIVRILVAAGLVVI